jgi:hypothetical protein
MKKPRMTRITQKHRRNSIAEIGGYGVGLSVLADMLRALPALLGYST